MKEIIKIIVNNINGINEWYERNQSREDCFWKSCYKRVFKKVKCFPIIIRQIIEEPILKSVINT